MTEVKLYQHVAIVESFFSVAMALKKLPPKIFCQLSKIIGLFVIKTFGFRIFLQYATDDYELQTSIFCQC